MWILTGETFDLPHLYQTTWKGKLFSKLAGFMAAIVNLKLARHNLLHFNTKFTSIVFPTNCYRSKTTFL